MSDTPPHHDPRWAIYTSAFDPATKLPVYIMGPGENKNVRVGVRRGDGFRDKGGFCTPDQLELIW